MKNTSLKFIGTGSCFNTKMGNTSAYYYNETTKHLFLIDCGETVFSDLRYSKILNEAKTIDILITHLHSDHAGSLESLIYFCAYVKNIVPTVIFPDKQQINSHLIRVSKEQYSFQTPSKYTPYQIIAIHQIHKPELLAYGYIILLNGKYIFYSGDAKTIDDYVLNLFTKGTISHIYQDVTKFENSVHLYIKDLAVKIPEEMRTKVTCMHFDDGETLRLAQELNFKVARKVYLQKI